ncbi:MAG: hypothetical protein QOI64_2317 [Solirubrobacteraceae bacterium]|jgi:hypothetical protein|nr:hypothetical protein [Solirubrobacteraceae bacterium]
MGSAGTAARTVADGRVAIARHLATTPGRLRLAAALLVLAAIAFGLIAAHVADERQRAVRSVAVTERLLVSAVELSISLSNTHAIAAFGFLRGGPDQPASRRLFKDALAQSSVAVAAAAGETGALAGSGPAVRRMTRTLPIYSQLIASARANYRQGFPVGNAYLREASDTMRDTMLPSARDLYELEAQRLTRGYRAGMSTTALLAGALAGCALLAALVWTQLFLSRTTRRLVNPGLALATALLLGLAVWLGVAFTVQHSALADAKRTGSDPVALLTATRILASRAQADESIALAARGGGEGEDRLQDVDRGFLNVTRPIRGLLKQASAVSGTSVTAIDRAYRRYLAAHADVVERVKQGDFDTAVTLAVKRGAAGGPTTDAAGDALNVALDREVAGAQMRFEAAAARADSAVSGLSGVIAALTALCVVLALFGVRPRLEEYR